MKPSCQDRHFPLPLLAPLGTFRTVADAEPSLRALTSILLALLCVGGSPVYADDSFEIGETGVSTRIGKGIAFERSGFGASLSGRFQPRLDVVADPFAKSDPDIATAAYVRRARIKVKAWGFGKRLSSTVQIELAELTPSVRDLYVDAAPFTTRWLRFRGGQLKKPFSWQQFLSTTSWSLSIETRPMTSSLRAGNSGQKYMVGEKRCLCSGRWAYSQEQISTP